MTTDLLGARSDGGFGDLFPLARATAMPALPPCLPNCVMNVDRKRSVITGISRRPSWGSTTLRRPYAAWDASLPGAVMSGE